MAEPQRRPLILVVDDDRDLLALIERVLSREYHVVTDTEPKAALQHARADPPPDLILLDVEMPGASGFDLCRTLKSDVHTAPIPVMFLTGKSEAKEQVTGLEAGAVDYITKPINAAVLMARVRTQVALANRQHELERLVRERTTQLESTRLQLIRRLSRAMEMHETSAVGNRVMRLSQYARALAHTAGAKPALAEMVMIAAPLHDVGKLGVPAEILRKTGKLSAPDWERVRRHPMIGAEIIGEHSDPLLRLAREMALTHHEHWDGTGYPRGLKGEQIPWSGRLMAIVDAFESMTATQFYRAPLGLPEAASEIGAGAGTRYDPRLVEAFKKALPLMKKVHEAYADELGDLINLDFAGERTGAARSPARAPGPERR